jgi:hypothetical protein
MLYGNAVGIIVTTPNFSAICVVLIAVVFKQKLKLFMNVVTMQTQP